MRHALICLMLALAFGPLSIGPARSGEVMLRGTDLLGLGPFGWIAPNFVPPPPDTSLPMVNPAIKDEPYAYLRRLASWRRAAGFAGVLYDNRDRGHSTLPADLFPTLGRLTYAPELRARDLDYGLGGAILLPAVVIGNSSTAVTGGPEPRSLPRLAMTSPGWPDRSFRTYASNHIYVYPEHRDHDEADLFPANWPYMVTSQGSSGSDQPFLRALCPDSGGLSSRHAQRARAVPADRAHAANDPAPQSGPGSQRDGLPERQGASCGLR